MIFVLHRKKKSPTAQAIQMSEPASQIPAEPAANSRSTEAAPPQSAPQSNPPPTKPKPIPSSNGDVVHKVLPDASRGAQNTITGTVKVTVRVDVDSAGKVSAAKLTSAGPSQYFAGLALKAAREWEFSPPAVDGASTPSQWAIEFRYKRNSIQASAERSKR
jgi:TonB family protein